MMIRSQITGADPVCRFVKDAKQDYVSAFLAKCVGFVFLSE